jgi:hypothetical protein
MRYFYSLEANLLVIKYIYQIFVISSHLPPTFVALHLLFCAPYVISRPNDILHHIVPLHPSAHHQAQGMQKTLPGADARKEYVTIPAILVSPSFRAMPVI